MTPKFIFKSKDNIIIANELKCLMLKAQEVLGPNHGITSTLEKMVDSPGLSVFG